MLRIDGGLNDESSVAALETVEESKDKLKIIAKRITIHEIEEVEKEDRVSALPDCLLLEILSRLPSKKDAIRTGSLSKRWKHIWTWVPTLSFKDSDLTQCQMYDFFSLVDKTLTQCRQLKLKGFKVLTGYNGGYESQVKNWIHYAVRRNVEELNLGLFVKSKYDEFPLDQSFFISSCINDMTLRGCKLNPTGVSSWKNLRSLSITDGKLDKDLIENILSGSPVLETLVLDHCRRLDITSKSVKNFVLSGHCGFDNKIIEINAPNILSLKIQAYHDRFLRCIAKPVGEISWKNLRCLSISDAKLDEDLIETILSGSPLLETLVLEFCYGFRRLDITSKSVKNLVLSGYYTLTPQGWYKTIKLNAPNILSLTIRGNQLSRKDLLVNVSSLVEANLYYEEFRYYENTFEEEEILKGFILNLLHVKELKLGAFCSQVLSRLEAKGFKFPSNIKRLDVTSTLYS